MFYEPTFRKILLPSSGNVNDSVTHNQYEKVMVSFNITSLHTNIPTIDTLNIINDYINGVAMRGPASSTTPEICMHAHERTTISSALHPPKVWEHFVDDVYSVLKSTHLEKY